MEKVHPALGKIVSPAAENGKEGEVREWYVQKFEREDYPDRSVIVVGDNSGPVARSFDDILEISEHCDEIEQLVTEKIYSGPKISPFASRQIEIDNFSICFFDRDDATHYSAHLTYSLPENGFCGPQPPFTECLGNGFFDLVFEMQGLEIIRQYPETEEHND